LAPALGLEGVLLGGVGAASAAGYDGARRAAERGRTGEAVALGVVGIVGTLMGAAVLSNRAAMRCTCPPKEGVE
jgi:hypothetical protein